MGKVMSADMIDDYIASVGAALGLPIEDAWKGAVRANLEVSLRMARLVGQFPPPDPDRSVDMTTASETPSASEIAKAVNAGRLSALEATEAALARIERYDGVLNSFTDVTAERARARAREG